MPNIRSRTVVAERLWDWEFLNGCFRPTKIRLSDVDGEVERNGFFLRVEAKPFGYPISNGQKILFDKLLLLHRKLADGAWVKAYTVLVLYGEPSVPEAMQVWPRLITNCGVEDVQCFVRDWFEYATAVTE